MCDCRSNFDLNSVTISARRNKIMLCCGNIVFFNKYCNDGNFGNVLELKQDKGTKKICLYFFGTKHTEWDESDLPDLYGNFMQCAYLFTNDFFVRKYNEAKTYHVCSYTKKKDLSAHVANKEDMPTDQTSFRPYVLCGKPNLVHAKRIINVKKENASTSTQNVKKDKKDKKQPKMIEFYFAGRRIKSKMKNFVCPTFVLPVSSGSNNFHFSVFYKPSFIKKISTFASPTFVDSVKEKSYVWLEFLSKKEANEAKNEILKYWEKKKF